MSRYRSYSRSRSRSRSRSPRRDRYNSSRHRGSRHSRSRSPDDGYRVYVGDLGIDCSKREIEKTFAKFGKLNEVWVARNPPCFAFVVFDNRHDAEEAVRDMDGRMLCGGRVRVSLARPRTRGRGRRSFDPNLRCYQCGDRGHFSRDCRSRRRPWPGRTREVRNSYSRSRSRSRSRERRRRSRSRSRSRSRDRRSRRKSFSAERSPSHGKSKSRSRSPRDRKSPVREKRSRSRSVKSSSKSPRKRRSQSGSPRREVEMSPDRRSPMVITEEEQLRLIEIHENSSPIPATS